MITFIQQAEERFLRQRQEALELLAAVRLEGLTPEIDASIVVLLDECDDDIAENKRGWFQ